MKWEICSTKNDLSVPDGTNLICFHNCSSAPAFHLYAEIFPSFQLIITYTRICRTGTSNTQFAHCIWFAFGLTLICNTRLHNFLRQLANCQRLSRAACNSLFPSRPAFLARPKIKKETALLVHARVDETYRACIFSSEKSRDVE